MDTSPYTICKLYFNEQYQLQEYHSPVQVEKLMTTTCMIILGNKQGFTYTQGSWTEKGHRSVCNFWHNFLLRILLSCYYLHQQHLTGPWEKTKSLSVRILGIPRNQNIARGNESEEETGFVKILIYSFQIVWQIILHKLKTFFPR